MSVNTKADIRFAVQRADFLPAWVKANLVLQEKNRMNSEGELVVNSSRHRTQKCVCASASELAEPDAQAGKTTRMRWKSCRR